MSKSEYTPEELADYVFRKLRNVNKPTSLPNKNVLDTLFKRLFFASLKTEEGQFIRVTVTLINPENPDPNPPDRVLNDRWQYVRFKETIPFTVKNLIKLSKAADPWSSSLAIYYNDKDELVIWGMIDQAIHYQSFLNYETENSPEQPGLFQVTITGIGSLIVMSNYELIATLKQDILISNYIDIFKKGEIHEILKSNTALFKGIITDVFKLIIKANRLLNWDSFIENLIYGSLSRILIRIQNYNHGGAFLITPYVTEDIDIKYSISYDRLFDSILALVKSTICSNIFENNVDFEIDRLLQISPYAEQSLIEEERRDTTNELKGNC